MINGFWKISHRFLSIKNSGILSKDIYKKFSKTYSGKNGFIPDLSSNQINLDNCYMDYLEMESVSLKETKLNECGALKFRMQIKEDLRRNFL